MRFAIWQTPFGHMGALAGAAGLISLTLPMESPEDVFRELLGKGEPAHEDSGYFAGLIRALTNYFNGQELNCSYQLDLSRLTPFRRKVLQAVATIPYGQVRSYKWVGESIGCLRGFRAIGQAVGANPFPVLIPCHRVIASDGSLGGYTGGLDHKRRFLRLEGIKIS